MNKPRRVRMADCPKCGQPNKVARKSEDNPARLTSCVKCFCVFPERQVPTWLEEPKAAKGGV